MVRPQRFLKFPDAQLAVTHHGYRSPGLNSPGDVVTSYRLVRRRHAYPPIVERFSPVFFWVEDAEDRGSELPETELILDRNFPTEERLSERPQV
jgi:hypothetical protein